jgi:hypothetical protein
MLALLGLLLVIWLIFIILGIAIHGLLWLLIIGVILFAATSLLGFIRREAFRHRRR